MNSLTKIRKAVFEDLGAILDLVRALARYEQAENAVTATLQDYEKNFLEGVFEASLLQEAISMDCRLLKWQVLDWNIPAINFYNKYDAIIEKQWWNGKLILDQPN